MKVRKEYKMKIVGEIICGYKIADKIWQGATSTIYKGLKSTRNAKYGDIVAIKVLHPYRNSKSYIEQFIKEYKIQKSLKHQNIVEVSGFGKEGDIYCIFMEYIEGKSLRLTHQERQIPPENLLSLIIQIGKAISYIHSKKIIHNDIKPENIIVDKLCECAKLTDFGYAEKLSFFKKHVFTQGGTENYMAPERKKGTSDFRTDIYSYGVIIEEFLLKEYGSEELYSIVAKATDSVSWRRYKSADEIVGALEEIYRELYR